MLRTSDFDYVLPEELVAQQPAQPRDTSRLMLMDRRSGQRAHYVFMELPQLLRPGDVVVVNDTRVIPARFECRRLSGGRIEGLFVRELEQGRWHVLLAGAGRCAAGETLVLECPQRAVAQPFQAVHMGTQAGKPVPPSSGPEGVLRLVRHVDAGEWEVEISPAEPAIDLLTRVGSIPLPPYIRRGQALPADREAYQTMYARHPGAVAAPTAGLHFTPELVDALAERRIELVRLTLHVGPGTFLPVKVEDLAQHGMHQEWYDLPGGLAEAVSQARRDGRRVVAVGTTTVRALETVAARGPLTASQGWTNLFLFPPAQFRAVDAMITNFHLPRSTLLMLVAAFCSPGRTDGMGTILDAYREAIAERYRFYSYGDAMLIE